MNIKFNNYLYNNKNIANEYEALLSKQKVEYIDNLNEFNLLKNQFILGVLNRSSSKKILIQGEKILIREACVDDCEFIHTVENDLENIPWIGNWERWFRIAKLGDDDFLLTIIETINGEKIGFIIFMDMINKEEQIYLKRIAITKKGYGYGKEAMNLAKKIAFDIFKTKKLYLKTRSENIRAQNLYKSVGFIPEMPDPCTSFYINKNNISL